MAMNHSKIAIRQKQVYFGRHDIINRNEENHIPHWLLYLGGDRHSCRIHGRGAVQFAAVSHNFLRYGIIC